MAAIAAAQLICLIQIRRSATGGAVDAADVVGEVDPVGIQQFLEP
jgi:hypothetical protein